MKTLTKLLSAATVAATLSVAAPASALTYIMDWSNSPDGGISLSFGDSRIGDATGAGIYVTPADVGDGTSTHTKVSNTFTDVFHFAMPDGLLGFTLQTTGITASSKLFFDAVDFNGTALTLFALGQGRYAVTGSFLAVTNGGPQTLTVHGHGGANSVWNGVGTFTPAAIPEPATWGLMIMGFGGVGGLLRRRRLGAAFA